MRSAFERWNTGERESLLPEIDPEVELRMASSVLSGQDAYRGHDGYREWIATMEDSFEFWELYPKDFHEEGDRMLVLGSSRLRGRGSGVELNEEMGWVIEFRDHRLLRMEAFRGHALAKQAFGPRTTPSVD
jgi:ketosteroid isomerase-like protein